MSKKNILLKTLQRHGVNDAAQHLVNLEKTNIQTSRATTPDVCMRGSLQLMRNRKTSRKQVQSTFDKLKYL